MKAIKILCLAIGVFASLGLFSQSKKVVESEFWVGGVCDMCKDRIERALDLPGIIKANYDLDSHILEIAYKSSKYSENHIHTLLNSAGHDTEKSTASDEQYGTVHECCKYRTHDHSSDNHSEKKSCADTECKDTKCADDKSSQEKSKEYEHHEHSEEHDDQDGEEHSHEDHDHDHE